MFSQLQNGTYLLSLVDRRGAPVNTPFDDIVRACESMSYEEDTQAVGELTLYLANPNGIFDDDARLQRGKTFFALAFGYPNYLSETKICGLRQISPEYGDDGGTKLELLCYDVGAQMGDISRPRNWGRVQTSDIAAQLAQDHGLVYSGPASSDVRDAPYVQPAGVTDLQFLKLLAKRRGWVAFMSGSALYFGPEPLDAAPALQCVWGAAQFPTSSVIGAPIVMQSFRPQMDSGRRKHTQLLAVDPNQKAALSAKADGIAAQGGLKERQSLGGQAVVSRAVTNFGTHTQQIEYQQLDPDAAHQQSSTERNQAQLQKDAATHQFDETKKEAVAHAVFAPGNPDLRVLKLLDIQGVSRTHAGLWLISNVVHRVSATKGYEVTVTCKRPGKNGPAGQASADKLKDTNQQALARKVERVSVATSNFASHKTVITTETR